MGPEIIVNGVEFSVTMEKNVIIVLLLTSLLLHSTECLRLNDFITHYEPLNYDHHQLHQTHSRLKRWVNQVGQFPTSETPPLQFQFEAHGRFFNVTLRRDENTFGEHFELHLGTDEPEPFVENWHLFEGELQDIPGSLVYGAVRNGIFDGKIVTPNGTFYIESSRKFSFPGESQGHSVIYKESDIDAGAVLTGPNGTTSAEGGAIPCGATNDINSWMMKIQTSRIPEEIAIRHGESDNSAFSEAKTESHVSSYSMAREFSSRLRSKRQVNSNSVSHRTTCTLHIRTDPMLWRHIAKQHGMEKAVISEEILSIVGQHVKTANEIFANSRFDAEEGNGPHKNIQFLVRRVKIDTDEECSPDYTGTKNPFCVENLDVSNYLDLHSRFNYTDFCLSYTFTYRDFTGGVVGLAWVASPENSGPAGGICEKYSGYSDFSSHRSLNTGIVTFLNYNRPLPPKISQLTFTHELGHNFGSMHDPDGDACQPGGKQGNFLMYSSATNGYLANNAKFSNCSLKNVGKVLDKILKGDSNIRNCFEATQSTFCGNQIVEKGEECDCGYDSVECTDKCCNPRRTGSGDRSQSNPEACKRSHGSDCSPSEGPCCESDCNFSPASQHQLKLCQIETECTESAFCTGRGPLCPEPIHKRSSDTLCNNGTQVCIEGVCRGSLCVKYGFEECYLKHEEYPDKSTLCDLACLNAAGQCVSISTLNVTSSTTLKLRPGTPCDNFRGYCDVFQKCRAVDERGPLLRLTKMLFNKDNYRNVVEWIKGHPWWSGFIGLIFILLLAMFVKCCAVHTPSSNPNLPQHLKFSETLQRPIRTLQRRRQTPADASAPPMPTAIEMGPPRGRRKPGPRPLPSERASMAPFH